MLKNTLIISFLLILLISTRIHIYAVDLKHSTYVEWEKMGSEISFSFLVAAIDFCFFFSLVLVPYWNDQGRE